MSFASSARWAACRSAHLSSWSRAVNAKLLSHSRGLSSAAVLRMAAEPRPSAGFVEQQGCVPGVTSSNAQVMGAEDSNAVESLEAVAALIDKVMAVSEFSFSCFGKYETFYLSDHIYLVGKWENCWC
eukprot:TRINITY_DN57751_c0_g1_i1.p1 TRINITY_DN57751_c0_g1~~TRINITY_DN57751_c0_g1_i1.p1  ORF type:complete len:127 (+),score=22.83 TRINITY_DN57751_c0_g1_i1:99-479(+)